MSMYDEEPQALTYTKETLIQSLTETRDKRIAERQAAKDKLAAKNKETKDRLVAALDNPRFLLWVAARFSGSGFDPTDENLAKKIAEAWPDTNGDEVREENDPDSAINRLIRVYEKAEDATVKVTVRDEVFKYL